MESFFFFFVVKCEYLTTLPVAETVQHRVIGWSEKWMFTC